ncbi:glycosyltransferase family 2 protein [Agrococcus sp. HG114]|uniref:glycosyltransferase family 2 protein n=1 Tax=Agrococcus sp. HG114 TaxID=2969757 RepID=UPI00215B3E98|nr:glycosyltransferase family 2 protein [Agrococcus sp. HG114]MCR8670608.1 glycosyltransferase [Agrococcus sp. HG114]
MTRTERPPRLTSAERTTRGLLAPALLVAAWALLGALVGLLLAQLAPPTSSLGWIALAAVAPVVALALLTGLRHVVLLVAARRAVPSGPTGRDGNAGERVALLYPVSDDFRADVVRRSAAQSHPGTRTVVLDDSSAAATRARIDALVAEGGIELHRRAVREGAKAGNLNSWLEGHGHEVDRVVVLDADQEIPTDFVEGALARFATHPDAAVVQGAIDTRRSGSPFVRDFGGLFARHAAVQLAGREALGVSVFCGRGAMLDVAALREVGWFPELVMEDTALSVELARRGHRVVAAPELRSVEDAPVDHAAFAVQFGKFVEGAVQLLARRSRSLLDARLPWLRRADLVLDLLVPVLAAILPLVLFAYSLVAAATAAEAFPWQLGLVLGALGLAPLAPEAAHRVRSTGLAAGLGFTVRAAMLYASVSVVAARAVLVVLVSGRARFHVTPKAGAADGAVAVVQRRGLEIAVAAAATAVAGVAVERPDAALPFVAIAAAGLAFGWRDARELQPVRAGVGAGGHARSN